MKINNNIKRVLLFVAFLFLTLWSFAQTQYDYYEGKDAYGGVDTAIKGLKILGIIILVVAVIVIVGGIWAKFMDFINPPKHTSAPNIIKPKIEPQTHTTKEAPIIPKRYVALTFIGKTIEADVTMKDGSKKTDCFWYDIDWITLYNHNVNYMFNLGNEIVKPAGSIQDGSCVNREDVKTQTIKSFICNYRLEIKGKFDPKKLQLIRIDGFGFFDRWVYYYNGEAQKQSIISDSEAETIVANTI